MTTQIAATVPVGTRCTFPATFTNDDTDALDDPTTMRFKVRDPSTGTTTTLVFGVAPEVVRTGVGRYVMKRILDKPGNWWIHAEGVSSTGGVNAVAEVCIRAEGNAIP